MQFIPPFDQIGVSPPGPWTNAAPQAGIQGSIVNADVFPAVQNELLAIIGADPSLTPSASDLGQALKAIVYLIGKAIANITAAQIFEITQQAPPGSGLAGTLARLDFMPTGADSSVLSSTFTAPAAGTVQASSILISSPQNGFSNAVEIDVNGAPVAQNADSIAGLIINVAAATVSKGDTVTVKGTVSSSQAAIYNTTQRFTYSFIPS